MRIRRLAAATAALTALLVAVPIQAQAATSGPLPVTALPSGLNAAWVAPMSDGQTNNFSTFAYNSTATQQTTDLAQARVDGTITPAQSQQLQQGASPVEYPTGFAANVQKGIGAGQQAYSNYQLGSSVGQGIVGLFGVDAQGTVCRNVGSDGIGKMVTFLSGANCDPNNFPGTFVPNRDASGELSMRYCNVDGCTTFTGTATFVTGGGRYTAAYCFSRPTKVTQLVYFYYRDHTGYEVGNVVGGQNNCAAGSSTDISQQTSSESDTAARARVDRELAAVVPIGLGPFSGPSTEGAPVTGSADPNRTLECVVVASDGKTYVGESKTFKESGSGFDFPTCATLPDGVYATEISMREKGKTDVLYTQKVPAGITEALTKYPECADGTCVLDLRKGGVSCFTDPAPCAGWYTDPNKATAYTCHYGSHDVALSECTLYAPTFKKTGTTVYGDPETGKTVPNPEPSTSTSCDSAGWSTIFQPSEIVSALTCNLAALFVPSADTVSNHLADLDLEFATTGPGAVTGILGSWDFHPTATGCAGIPIDFSMFQGTDGSTSWPNACEGEFFGPVAGTSRVALTIVFLAGAGIVAYNVVGSIFGAAPIRFGRGDSQ